MTNAILVPVDGSAHSKKAVEFACKIAEKFDSKVRLLHIAHPLHEDKTMVLGAAAVTVHASKEELEKAGRQVLESAVELARGLGCNDIDTEIEQGDPAQKIVDAATREQASMIVMGTRGLSDLSGLMLGSVSHKVNHLAPCTCVTVR